MTNTQQTALLWPQNLGFLEGVLSVGNIECQNK